MANRNKAKITRQIARAGKNPPAGNSGIFSNSGFGQKYDNKQPTNMSHSYAVNVGSHAKLRETLHAAVGKTSLLGAAAKAPAPKSTKD